MPHTDALNINDGKSIFIVFKWSTATLWDVLLSKNTWNTDGWLIFKKGTGSILFQRSTGGGSGTSHSNVAGDIDMLSCMANNTGFYSYINGDDYQSNAIGTVPDSTRDLHIGVRDTSHDPWTGDVHEIVIIDDEVDTGTRQIIVGYLAHKGAWKPT